MDNLAILLCENHIFSFFFGSKCLIEGYFQVMKNKSPFVGGSPEYWSTEQGAIFDTMRDSIKDPRTYSGFINTLPHITEKVETYH